MFGCCDSAEETLELMSLFVVWALIPFACPLYSRKNWLNYDKSVDWIGLLESHHKLYTRVMIVYVGKPKAAPVLAVVASNSHCSDSWLLALCDDHAAAPTSAASAAPKNSSHNQPEADGDGAAGETGEDISDFAKQNQINRSKVAVFVTTDPYTRLAVLREMLAVVLGIMAHLLEVGSKKWKNKQKASAAQGKGRTYVVVEAALGEDMLRAFTQLLKLIHSKPTAVHTSRVNGFLRAMRFRMNSASMCAIHALLRNVREGMPYQLFRILLGQVAFVKSFSSCLWDELAAMICTRFKTEDDLLCDECYALTECIASEFDVDIGPIEAKHSTTREFTLLRSRGWTPSLETVSAKFCCSFSDACHSKHKNKQGPKDHQVAPKTDKSKTPRTQGGGGGAWRAFVHDKCAGEKLTADRIQELSIVYAQLSDHDMQKYQQAGEAATIAHRHRFKSFVSTRLVPAKTSTTPALLQGDVTADGAIVLLQGDHLPAQSSMFSHNFALVKQSVRHIKDPQLLDEDEQKSLDELQANTSSLPLVQGFMTTGQHSDSNAQPTLQRCFEQTPMLLPNMKSVEFVPPISRMVQAAGYNFEYYSVCKCSGVVCVV